MKPAVHLERANLQLGGRYLWRNMSLTVQPGELIAVLGPNGAGKSSFIKTLLGLYPLASGAIKLFGQPIKEVRQQIGYIPQQKAFDRSMPISGRDFVRFGMYGTHFSDSKKSGPAQTRIQQALTQVGAASYADQPLGRLSGGQQQRLRIAQALVAQPSLLLCDEPLLSLDLGGQNHMSKLIGEQKRRGAAVIFVTHEINPILPLVNRVLYIVNGKWAIGAAEEVLTSARLSGLYGSPVEVLRVHNRILVIGGEDLQNEPANTHHHLHEVSA